MSRRPYTNDGRPADFFFRNLAERGPKREPDHLGRWMGSPDSDACCSWCGSPFDHKHAVPPSLNVDPTPVNQIVSDPDPVKHVYTVETTLPPPKFYVPAIAGACRLDGG